MGFIIVTVNKKTLPAPTLYSVRWWVLHVLRILLGLLLAFTAIGKGLDLSGFAKVIGTYDVLPEVFWFPTAVVMTLIEGTLSIMLLGQYKLRGAALGSVGLHMAFTIWAAVALLRGLTIENCGCFGVFLARPLAWSTVLEDGVLLALSILLWALCPREGEASTPHSPIDPSD